MAQDPGGDDRQANPESAHTDAGPAFSTDLLEIDYVYEALAHSRRRYLCYTLLEATEWSLTDLAAKLAAWEHDIPESEVNADQRDRVYVSLFHAHVPKLVADDIIEFDPEAETISVGPNADQVLAALEGIGASLDANQETHARREIE